MEVRLTSKRKTPSEIMPGIIRKVTVLLEVVGLVLCCAFNRYLAGVILLVAAIAMIAMMREVAIREVLKEEAKEKAERMAESKFRRMLLTADIRVHQRMTITDEMGVRKDV